jgi:23S rRNA (guanosine2251-2'-O)-methyltransferase
MSSSGPKVKYEYLYGTNAIRSLLNVNAGNRKIKRLLIPTEISHSKKIESIKTIAVKKGIVLSKISRDRFKEISQRSLRGEKLSESQSIIAEVTQYNYSDISHKISKKITGREVFLMLDGITDIGNFSAILRNCSAFNASGVIISRHRSVSINNRVSKISSGALEEIKVFMVKNLVHTLSMLKDNGFWIYGSTLEEDVSQDIDDADFTLPMVMVMGNEEKGISRLVKENCDVLVNIPQRGKMQSLNVSVASGILLYSIQQRLYRSR